METKAPHPGTYLEKPVFRETDPLFSVYFEINQLKLLYRQGWLRRGVPKSECESVAEHSFAVVFLAMWISERWYPQLNQLDVLRLAIIHDLGEVYCGDLTPVDGVSSEEKRNREEQAVKKILGRLQGSENYLRLWNDYENQSTGEARLVRCIDRLEMALQALVYEFQTGLDLKEFIDSAARVLSGPDYRQLLADLAKIRPNQEGSGQAASSSKKA